jgi:type I restriction enzyme S subunit
MSKKSELIRLGDLCETISGLWTGKKPPYEKAKVIRNTNFTKDCKLDLSNVAVLDVETKQLQTRRLIPGDLILEKSGGGPKQAVGRVVYFNETEGTYSLSNFTTALRLKDSTKALPMYLRHFLYFQYISGVTENMQSHSTGIRNLNIHQFLDIKIPLPSMDKQREIVEKLDRAFAEIELFEKNLELRDEKVNQLFQSLLSDSYGTININTVLHQEQSIGEICEVGDGNHSSKYPTKNEMISAGVPFIRAQNIVNGTISETDILYISKQKHETLRKGHLNAGDILITNRGEIGKLAIVPAKFHGSNLNSQIAWLRCGKVVRNSYLYYFLKSESARRFFDSGTSGSALQQLTISKLKEIKVPVVSLADQEAIVKKLDNAFAEIDFLRAQFKKDKSLAVSLRQSLLSNAFSQEEVVA